LIPESPAFRHGGVCQDWLIFLTDNGLAQFIDNLLLNPTPEYIKVQLAFKNSYAVDKKRNVFTKVRMDLDADAALVKYFSNKSDEIHNGFNVISPSNRTLLELKNEMVELRSKRWAEI
jgi:hypothetical protein